MQLGDFAPAAQLLRQSTRVLREHHAVWFKRGMCEMRLRHKAEAKYCFDRVSDLIGWQADVGIGQRIGGGAGVSGGGEEIGGITGSWTHVAIWRRMKRSRTISR